MNLEGLESMNELNIAFDWMDKITILFSTLAIVGTGYNFYKQRLERKQEAEKIKISFDVEGAKYLLDLDMPRKHISRSEVQGILAAFQENIKGRYSLAYLSDIAFLDDIFKIQNNEIERLNIRVTLEEFNQFNQKKMKKYDLH